MGQPIPLHLRADPRPCYDRDTDGPELPYALRRGDALLIDRSNLVGPDHHQEFMAIVLSPERNGRVRCANEFGNVTEIRTHRILTVHPSGTISAGKVAYDLFRSTHA